MDEVRARADKHMEAEETAASKDERDTKGPRRQESPTGKSRLTDQHHFSGRHDRGGKSRNRRSHPNPEATYTPLRVKPSAILGEGLSDPL